MSPGYQVVQSTHSVADFASEFPDTFMKWKSESNSIICLDAKNEQTLLKFYDQLREITQSVIFFEPDVNQYTSMCVYGTPEVRKKLRNLQLLLLSKNKKQNVLEKGNC